MKIKRRCNDTNKNENAIINESPNMTQTRWKIIEIAKVMTIQPNLENFEIKD